MRITGGIFKGKILASFKGMNIRPTSDLVREAIFNILGHRLEGKYVLDLFSGTGALGLEALSRGAHKAVFVDKSPKSIRIIKKNLELCGANKYAVVLKKDLRKGVSFLVKLFPQKYDLVFLDPPYRKGLLLPTIGALLEWHLLAPRAEIIAETSKFEDIQDIPYPLNLRTSKVYGDTKLYFYQMEQ